MSKNVITKTLENPQIFGAPKKSKIFFSVVMSILVFVLMTSAVSAALPIDSNSIAVKIDDQTVTSGSTTRLNIEREQEFEVKVVLTSTDVVSNVEIQAFVSGYEYNDVERIFASTPLFDLAANVSYTKRLMLRLPSDASTDNYKLRLVISDRNNDAIVKNYDLRLDAPRHLLRVDDVNVFTGSNQVTSGDPLLVNVRVKNLGERNEEDIKVKVSVPELGLVGTKYIDSIRTDKSEETGNIYMKLPKCAESGVYPVAVDVSYNNYKSTVSDESQAITVLKNTACDKPAEEKKVIVVEVQQPPQTPAPAVQENTDNNENTISKVRSILEIFLVVLFAVFIVIGIVVFFSRLMSNPDDEE